MKAFWRNGFKGACLACSSLQKQMFEGCFSCILGHTMWCRISDDLTSAHSALLKSKPQEVNPEEGDRRRTLRAGPQDPVFNDLLHYLARRKGGCGWTPTYTLSSSCDRMKRDDWKAVDEEEDGVSHRSWDTHVRMRGYPPSNNHGSGQQPRIGSPREG